MTTYPSGVAQNFAVVTAPLDLRPVPDTNWRMFANLADANAGLGMIEGVTNKAVMIDAAAVGGMYSQFVYLVEGSDIRARLVYGLATDAQGLMAIVEYPSDILDRDSIPLPAIDLYTPGQPHFLKVRRITPTLGQLYWAAN